MNKTYFIEENWLSLVRGKPFFYPCAGSDWDEFIEVFGDICSELWFCDIIYPQRMKFARIKSMRPLEWILVDQKIGDNHRSEIVKVDNYNDLEPSRYYQIYQKIDQSFVTIIGRHGHGQMALYDEFEDNSIGIFCHRGDSIGEGGSNIWFFDNRKSSDYKLENLALLVARKMSRKALIITDGSNSPESHHIHKYTWSQMEGSEAYKNFQGRKLDRDGLVWQCVGYLGHKNGPTLVWGIEKN